MQQNSVRVGKKWSFLNLVPNWTNNSGGFSSNRFPFMGLKKRRATAPLCVFQMLAIPAKVSPQQR